MPRNPDGRPHPVDVHVGSRVRLRRTLRGMSQGRLGDALGLTFQQVQKYERGTNRIGASRLYALSRVLDVPVGFFFDAMPEDAAGREGTAPGGQAADAAADPLSRRETLELVRAYSAITDRRVRKQVFDLAKALARAAPSDAEVPAAQETDEGAEAGSPAAAK